MHTGRGVALRSGGRWPSVTECLQLAGLVDLSMIPRSILEKAKVRGSLVHEWTERIDRNNEAINDLPDNIVPYINAWQFFKHQLKVDILAVEYPVKNVAYRYDGRLDRLALIQGRKCVIDIKCVYALHHTTALQTAGYAACLSEPHDRYAVQLKPDGTYAMKQYTSRHDRSTFLATVVLAHYHLEHKGELPWLVP